MAAFQADKVVVSFEAKVDRHIRDVSRMGARFDRNMADMRRSVERMEANVSRSMRKASSSAGQMSRDIRAAVSGLALGLAIREVTQYADAWTEAGNKIAAAGTPLDKQGERLSELADLAIDTRSAFDATASLYARLGIATETLTDKNYDLLKVTELINKATVAGGASTSERNSTVLQLSQALASGQLMGEELRSLRENAPILLRAIAKEFEVPIGALKDLGAEGKLTSERILDAILNAEGEIADRFSKTQVTISDSFTNLRTRVTEYIGTADDSLGMSEKLASAIQFVADNVDAFAEALVIAGAALTGALGASVALSVVNGLNSIAVGATAAAKAMAMLRAAAMFLGGPWVIGISAAAGALAYLAIEGGKANKELDDARKLASKAGEALRTIDSVLDDNTVPVATERLNKLKEAYYGLALGIATAAEAEKQRRIEATLAERQDYAAALKLIEGQLGKRDMKRAGNAEKRFSLEADAENLRAQIDVMDAELTRLGNLRVPDIAKEIKLPTTETEPGKPDKGTLSAIRSIEDAWADAFMTKRQLAEKDYQDTLSEIEGMKTSQAQKDDLAQKALELRDKQLKDIRQEELDGIQAVLDARDSAFENEIALINRQADAEQKAIAAKVEDADEAAAAIAAIEETRLKRIQDIKDQEAADDQALIDQVMAARAQALGNYEELAQAEYEILRDKIERELTAEQGKYEVLAALEEAHAETVKDIRERMKEDRIREALEEAETMGEGFRAQWDYMRSEAEHATAEIGMLFADTFGPGGTVQEAIGQATAQALIFGDSFEESIGRAAQAIAGDLISALVSYGVQMAMQTVLGQSLGASATAASIAQGAATAAAWAPAAAAVSLASFGANAAPAQAGIASTYGLTAALSAAAGLPGFEQGGYTGGGGRKKVAGVVHGQEFVNDSASTKVNYPYLEAMNNGLDMGRYIENLTQPVSINPSFMAGGRTINIAGSSIIFNGPVDRDTAPQFQAMLDQQRRELTQQFERKMEEYDKRTTPRYERNRFWKG